MKLVHLEGLGALGSAIAWVLYREGIPFTWHDIEAEHTAWKASTSCIFPTGHDLDMRAYEVWDDWCQGNAPWMPVLPGLTEICDYWYCTKGAPHKSKVEPLREHNGLRLHGRPSMHLHTQRFVERTREYFDGCRIRHRHEDHLGEMVNRLLDTIEVLRAKLLRLIAADPERYALLGELDEARHERDEAIARGVRLWELAQDALEGEEAYLAAAAFAANRLKDMIAERDAAIARGVQLWEYAAKLADWENAWWDKAHQVLDIMEERDEARAELAALRSAHECWSCDMLIEAPRHPENGPNILLCDGCFEEILAQHQIRLESTAEVADTWMARAIVAEAKLRAEAVALTEFPDDGAPRPGESVTGAPESPVAPGAATEAVADRAYGQGLGVAPPGHETERPTVRVRVAVAVSELGEYNTRGWSGGDDREKAAGDLAEWTDGARIDVHFIEADVPLPVVPESVTIEGEVFAETKR